MFNKVRRSLRILKYTNNSYFRARQLQGFVDYRFNDKTVKIGGQSVFSMIEEIIISDVYHLRNQIKPTIIFDVGANVGVFSLHAATLFPDCQIFAFEPSVENFKVLKLNTRPFANIHCFNSAISNYNGRGYLNGDQDNTAFTVASSRQDKNSPSCETTTIDTFTKNSGIHSIDILKLDCEGAEYDITLSNLKMVKQIVGEYHIVEAKNPGTLQHQLLNQGFYIKEWAEFALGGGKELAHHNSGIFWAVQ